jgi:predicted DNA-binding protein
MKRFTINIPEELHKRLKIASTLEGKNMTSVVIKMVEEYVERIEKRKLIVLQTKK